MTDEQSASSCGCVWERSEEYGDVIITPCTAHRAPTIGEDVVPDIEDRVRRILDYELDQLVIAAAKGKRVQLIQGPDPTRGR